MNAGENPRLGEDSSRGPEAPSAAGQELRYLWMIAVIRYLRWSNATNI
jgi:hypothetical protein